MSKIKNSRVLYLLLVCLITKISYAKNDIVEFAEINLKTAVENQLGITDPNISDMQNLTYLNAESSGITDLTGLEYAVKLKTLELRNNTIEDLSPLSPLASLTSLELSDNNMSDLSSISTLTSLTHLMLDSNVTISDLGPLSTLAALKHLNLTHNSISDVSPLSSLSALESLVMRYNDLSDSSGLSTLPLSLVTIHFDVNNISDVTVFSRLTSLKSLGLKFNNVSDISSLTTMINIIYLNLCDNPLNSEAYMLWKTVIETNNPDASLYFCGYSGDPAIMVVYPNNNEVVLGGRNQKIVWKSLATNSVEIHSSADNGSNWDWIATIPSDDIVENSFIWQVHNPNTSTTENIIRVVVKDDGSAMDESDVFSIYPCSIGDNQGDMNNDCAVDIKDFVILAENWLNR